MEEWGFLAADLPDVPDMPDMPDGARQMEFSWCNVDS